MTAFESNWSIGDLASYLNSNGIMSDKAYKALKDKIENPPAMFSWTFRRFERGDHGGPKSQHQYSDFTVLAHTENAAYDKIMEVSDSSVVYFLRLENVMEVSI